ncbi:sensor histidine kinase [Amphibacillus sp. Q70]|uniref:sensor histidine kinase n=1 Tax=Amphibacillus sp. Q70 TaxID=3453416 RepID=UPI003F82D3B4
MEMRRFESKVRSEMFRFSILTIFIMLCLTLILFGLYSINVRKARLEQTADNYSISLTKSMESFENDFYNENKKLFYDFLAGKSERSQVFSTFYAFNSSQDLKSDLLVIDDTREILLSTNPTLGGDNAFLHYISIVMARTEEKQTMTTRVYQALNGEQYLLLFYPFTEQSVISGFGVSVINGKEIPSFQIDSSVNFVIYDQYQNIFATNVSHVIQTSRGKADFSFLTENDRLLGGQYDTVRQPIADNLTVMTYQKFDSYLTVLYRSIIGVFIVTIIVVIQSFYFSQRISRKIGNSLHIINEEMEKVKSDSTYLLTIQTGDEFEILAEQINKMLTKLTEINNANIQLNQLNLEIEKRRLDAQFNPHFLANTLESIRSVMYVDPNVASQLILRMNKILRYSIDEETSDITLEEDIEYLKDYLEINHIRLEEFQYTIEIHPELYSFAVPKLFLLPLVENSLKYGYRNRRDLAVKISIIQSKKDIKIRVIDNGGALKEETAKEINEALQQAGDIINQHGLKNTKQRIELFYSNSKFRIFTKLGFTIIEIRIEGD